jgi:calcium-translocating P-type ATPase
MRHEKVDRADRSLSREPHVVVARTQMAFAPADLRADPPAWHALPVAECLRRLDSAADGLQPGEAAHRLETIGRNRLPQPAPPGIVRLFARQFLSPLVYLLVAAALFALVIGDGVDAWFIFGVLLLNAVVGVVQERKADTSAQALRKLIRQVGRVRRAGTVAEVDAEALVPGDVVEIETGMNVPADIRLIGEVDLTVDESLLTGESAPVAKHAETDLPAATAVADRVTMLHAGTIVARGRATGVVVSTAGRTALGAIAGSLSRAQDAPSPLTLRIGRLSSQIAIGVMLLIGLVGGLLLLRGTPADEVFLLAVALAVSAIPEGLPIAVTVALSAASWRMARRNVIVRNLPAVEGLGACTAIATDKTGTLTMNQLSVVRVVLADGRELSREAWVAGTERSAVAELATSAVLCNEASGEGDEATGDSVDVALLHFAEDAGIDVPAIRRGAICLAQRPYEPAAKFTAILVKDGGAATIHVKGASETIFAMCADPPGPAAETAARLAGEGYRILALAEGAGEADGDLRELRGLKLLGFVGLADPLRPEVPDAIAACRAAGIGVRMVTGDHPATALAIGRTLGLAKDQDEVATGAEIAALEGEALRTRLARSTVLARFEPAQKLALVQALQAGGALVAVTGDGVNDAPALKAAHIGVAMGRGGTDVARGVADLVLADDNFASIVAGVEEGRVTYDNVRRVVIIMLTTGFSEIAMFLIALVTGLPMPLTAVQLLWLNFVTNGLQDVTLGFERGTGDELTRPPRAPDGQIVDRSALALMVPPALYMALVAMLLFQWQLSTGATVDFARNVVLFTTVLFQNIYVLCMRSERLPLFRINLFSNPWLLAGIVGAQLLQLAVQHIQFFGTFLDTAPLGAGEYLTGLAAALGLGLVVELTKRVVFRSTRKATYKS